MVPPYISGLLHVNKTGPNKYEGKGSGLEFGYLGVLGRRENGRGSGRLCGHSLYIKRYPLRLGGMREPGQYGTYATSMPVPFMIKISQQ